MKKLFIVASAVGVAIAGLVLYYQRKGGTANSISGAAKDAYQTMNNGLGKVERPEHQEME